MLSILSIRCAMQAHTHTLAGTHTHTRPISHWFNSYHIMMILLIDTRPPAPVLQRMGGSKDGSKDGWPSSSDCQCFFYNLVQTLNIKPQESKFTGKSTFNLRLNLLAISSPLPPPKAHLTYVLKSSASVTLLFVACLICFLPVKNPEKIVSWLGTGPGPEKQFGSRVRVLGSFQDSESGHGVSIPCSWSRLWYNITRR